MISFYLDDTARELYNEFPEYGTDEAAGFDLKSTSVVILLPPGSFRLIPTGVYVSLPKHSELQIRPRSGLAIKHGITVLNSPGTIDSDYRGEIGVALINHGKAYYEIKKGDKIAQAVYREFLSGRPTFIERRTADRLGDTSRGARGFGSTGR